MLHTTKEHFEYFKECVTKWMEKLNVTGWHVYLHHELLNNAYATVGADYRLRTCSISLSTMWDETIPLSKRELDSTAKHEVVHLLVRPLYALALDRFATVNEIDAIEEELVIRLEGLL